MKLSPPLEEEEGFATRVVDGSEHFVRQQRPAAAAAVVVTGTVELGEEEFSSLVKVLGDDKSPDVEEMDVEITDDEDESKAGDDGDSAVGGVGIKRKRTVRVVIRSRAFL
ncbi:hypothetical protein G6011_03851 [Alternaria panax]|uniref:Uncharacterized protein n=1 Tax=Alternaria panax TaxID=48097 RepID=A0AAD4IG84_9PLEO|nr:hypothetical protein G6011_03851 [Alternaria panax]